jgi:uncharacterized coiled-coil protein SlyX
MRVDMAERVAVLEVTQARVDERITDLEEYRRKQNGTLQRLEEKIDTLNRWLIGLLGGVIASLLLLLINIAVGR